MNRSLAKMTWVETKLFLREPVTVIFTLALPLMILYVLGGVFGNEADTGGGLVVYGGYGPTNFYTPAYVALAVAGIALIGVPTHMVEYRESGVLRRLRASAVKRGLFLSSQALVSLLVATVGAGLLLAAAFMFTAVEAPRSAGLFVGAYALGAMAIAAIGLMLGTVLPTARAAQSVGLLLWFMFMFLSGAGPPPEVLPDALRAIGDWMPLTPVVQLLQGPWLSGDWPLSSSLITAGMTLVSGAIAWAAFRWE
ncbi:MAG: ABC transporter permease [Acidimicrobiia bacterium]|nr:ABC transporter permease [Acidimicrobiia bacterium]